MKRARGFTLVEMLVALVAFSLLTAAAAAVLNLSLRNAVAFDGAASALRDIQLARAMMRADFGQIGARPTRDAYGAPHRAIFAGGAAAGDKALVTFVRHGWDNPGGGAGRSSLQYVEYAVLDGALIRRSRPYLDPTPETPVVTTTLFQDVAAARVSFLSRGTWSDQWTASRADSLPDAVAVTVEVPGTGEIRQAFLVGAP